MLHTSAPFVGLQDIGHAKEAEGLEGSLFCNRNSLELPRELRWCAEFGVVHRRHSG